MGITTIEQFVFSLYLVYSLLIILYVLMSWLQLPYNIWVGRIRGFLHDTVEPILRPITNPRRCIRRVAPPPQSNKINQLWHPRRG